MPEDNTTTTPTTTTPPPTTDDAMLPPVQTIPSDFPLPATDFTSSSMPNPSPNPAAFTIPTPTNTTSSAAMPDPAYTSDSASVPTPMDTSDQTMESAPSVAPEPISSPVVDPLLPDEVSPSLSGAPSIYQEVTNKIADSNNVLIALSSDPSVDEMCAAIGLSLYLDKLGKRATAIYSGATPNALEFLKPEETFEPSADTLQDFVIALNKEKADHLRYKLDGDYVKIYITPYRTKISADDLDFSYGDYNVDLVLALDVANGIDLDSALREHGRIMHDAVIINITTGNPGKFGEIEWSDKKASSISEMIVKMLYTMSSDVEIGKEEATAFLTGIVAATNRFSNAQTTPETMQVSSRLMRSGANQQLISRNITPDVDNELHSLIGTTSISNRQSHNKKTDKTSDRTKLDIQHNVEDDADETKEVETTVTEKESTLLDDLKAAEASLAQTGAEATPELSDQPFRLDTSDKTSSIQEGTSQPDLPSAGKTDLADQIDLESLSGPSKQLPPLDEPSSFSSNPAADKAPIISSEPEANDIPDMTFLPPKAEDILPPPPAPPVDMSTPDLDSSLPSQPIEPAKPTTEPEPQPLGPQPAMQDQVYQPHASSPDSFKIPGM